MIAEIAHQPTVEELLAENAKLKEENRKLRALATIDSLTRLPNRRYLEMHLRREWKRAKRHQSPIGLLMVDADRFKAINDRHGHPYGDLVLKDLAAILKRIPSRPGDLVARFGGEEFACILPDTPISGAERVAELMLRRVRLSDYKITVSIGVACTVPTGDDYTKLVAAADSALYEAKNTGRDRLCKTSLVAA